MPVSSTPVNPATPCSSSLSPLATPFYPSVPGRSKFLRWQDPDSPDLQPLPRPSYRDTLCGRQPGLEHHPTPHESPAGRQTAPDLQPTASDPPQPVRIRLRSEIHWVQTAASDDNGWRVVKSRRGRRAAPRHSPRQSQRCTQIPAVMDGRCFNCLQKGHRKLQCREPTCCLRM